MYLSKTIYLKRIFSLFFVLISSISLLSSQNILIEEFTNLSAKDYNKSHKYIDSVASKMFYRKYHIIKYHTDFPEIDTFNSPVKAQVINRLSSFNTNVNAVPTTIVDGKHLPTGSRPKGNTLNLKTEFLENIQVVKNIEAGFFGYSLHFSDDFKKITSLCGIKSSNGLVSQTVYMTQVLVEEVVDLSSPVGPDGFQNFTYIFRGFFRYRVGVFLNPTGSYHGSSEITIPKEVIEPSNLRMIAFIEDTDYTVIDCIAVTSGLKKEYKIEVTNNTPKQSNYCGNQILPSIVVKNKCQYGITGFKMDLKIGNLSESKIVYDTISPGESKEYYFNPILLEPGRHYVNTDVDYIIDSPNEADIIKTNDSIRYLVAGKHAIPNEDFENLEPNSIGDFMVRSQNNVTFIKVDGSSLGFDKPIGGYGNSENCLIVDSWDWKYDQEDAGISKPDNKNFAFLHYSSFDLSNIKYPALYFDVATSYSNYAFALEIGAYETGCLNGYDKLKTFSSQEISKAPELRTARFIPKNNEWLTKKVSLDDYENLTDVQLRFFVRCPSDRSRGNSIYFDNIRIQSDTNMCFINSTVLRNQMDVHNFVRDMKNCNILKGNLCIGECVGDSNVSNITDLSGLTFIREIQGSLTIKNNKFLSTLVGLEFLKKVDGDFNLTNNPVLKNTTELNSINYIGGSIQVINNQSLERIEFQRYLPELNGNFIIKNNPMVTIIQPMINATEIKGDLILHDITASNVGTNLSSVKTIKGSISFQNNLKLAYTPLINNLQKIGGDLIIAGNPELISILNTQLNKIGGDLVIKDLKKDILLPNLDSLGGSLTLENNDNLSSIAYFDNLNYDYFFSNTNDSFAVVLTNNPSLSNCNSALMCRLIKDNEKPILVYGNANPCSSYEEIIVDCSPSSTSKDLTTCFYIYPNPTSDILFLNKDCLGTYTVRIVNGLGQVVYEGINGQNIREINVESFSNGVYTLIVDDKIIRFTKI